ncbi:phage terminase small subunit [Modicisalibacter xianhensis]|uniref:Phage terminase small subunit n=1 Tax=Modicisalibacter xianhensis TaxID=442341 RepID=A0A4R8FVC9_9GAMM|nr:terminase small subunit [Halomonas xianhensis]TDX30768.1 phage terminase small subunit [Halomonas xianhensis]
MTNKAAGAVELTPKQARFVEEYLKDLNATQAAMRAGYSEKTAYRTAADNLKKPQIADAIQRAMNKRSERTQIDADFVLQGIARNIARCEQGSPVLDKSGDPVLTEGPDGQIAPMWRYDPTNALKGYEMLGRHLKMFTDKTEHSGEVGFVVQTAVPRDPGDDVE